MFDKISPELRAYQEQRLNQLIQENQASPEGAIAFVGDSITEFFPLKKFLGRELPLCNRGIAGTDSQWLVEHLSEQVLSLAPKKLFLMIGVNDIGMGHGLAETVERVVELLNQIRMESFGTEVYLLSVLPVNQAPEFAKTVKVRNNAVIQDLNSRLQLLAGAEYVNLYPLLLDAEGELGKDYTTDGLHLSQLGYEKLATVLRAYL